MYIADLLSRSFINKKIKDDASLSKERLKELKTKTQEDPTLSKVKIYCEYGWPEKCKQFLDAELLTFFKVKSELYVKNYFIYCDEKIIIPRSLCKSMLNKLHSAQLCIEKTKTRARKIFYWSGMTKKIEIFMSKCEVCQVF